MFKTITGTFLDGIECDVPSQNWGRVEWARQFDVLKAMGMDTVIIIRVGWHDIAMYDSQVIRTAISDPDDRVALLLNEAQRTGLRLYLGLYDSCKHWREMNWAKEVAINTELIDELLDRYGKHPAFHGWYLSHEPPLSLQPWQIWNPLLAKIRKATPAKPVLLSPRFEGRKWADEPPKSPEEYAELFDQALSRMEQPVDAAAFMDGHVAIGELSEYMIKMKPVLAAHHINFWSNLETFDRDMPFRFPPLDWLKLRKKLEIAQPHVTKVITFEAPHFLSPYSMWESARMLYQRYMEYLSGLPPPH